MPWSVSGARGRGRPFASVTMSSITRSHIEAKTAWDNGATEEQMKPILKLIRNAQWRWDFVAASHGGSFHAPLECARILGNAVQKSEEARMLLTSVLISLGVKVPVQIPDITTKEKAQIYIGLDMEELKRKKAEFLTNEVPVWDRTAEERGSKVNYDMKNK